jgi:hypothetical protein
MGKKKNDREAFSSRVKKEENPWIRVPLLASVTRVLYDNWQPAMALEQRAPAGRVAP